MGQDYWEQFMHTGRVEDYLSYKDSGSFSQTACTFREERAGVEPSERDNHSDRDGTVGIAGR